MQWAFPLQLTRMSMRITRSTFQTHQFPEVCWNSMLFYRSQEKAWGDRHSSLMKIRYKNSTSALHRWKLAQLRTYRYSAQCTV